MITVQTNRLLLRECLAADAEMLRTFDCNPAIWTYCGGEQPTEAQSARRLARKLSAATEQPRTRFPLLVFTTPPSVLIGTATLRITHIHNREMELSGALDPCYWGQGLATEAGRAVIEWIFMTLAMHRIWAVCNPENTGSWRVMEKLGMRREGHLRRVERVGTMWRDHYLYALTQEEWHS